ncbi:MAG: DUF4276 family protein [bacterium]
MDNPNSILFLFEGETEREFYDILFDNYQIDRKIKINKIDLKGIWSINEKVKNRTYEYLAKSKSPKITVIIAHDREGIKSKKSCVNLNLLKKEFVKGKNSRIKEIKETIATQDLESWLFHDIDNIYKHLKTPSKERNTKNYLNVESKNNTDLSTLFHKYGKHYQKGSKVEGFLLKLDFVKIYNKTPELQELIKYIKSLIEE